MDRVEVRKGGVHETRHKDSVASAGADAGGYDEVLTVFATGRRGKVECETAGQQARRLPARLRLRLRLQTASGCRWDPEKSPPVGPDREKDKPYLGSRKVLLMRNGIDLDGPNGSKSKRSLVHETTECGEGG